MEFSETDKSYSIYNSHGKTPTMLRNPQYQRRCFLQRFYSGDVTQSYGTKRNCALS